MIHLYTSSYLHVSGIEFRFGPIDSICIEFVNSSSCGLIDGPKFQVLRIVCQGMKTEQVIRYVSQNFCYIRTGREFPQEIEVFAKNIFVADSDMEFTG